MKKVIFNTLALALVTFSAFAGGGKIQFETTKIVLEKIQQGSLAKGNYKFTNTGNDVLIIKQVKPG